MSLRLKISRISSKKVPLVSLVLVAIAGMAVGVFAATISVTTTSNYTGGEAGILHTAGGILTFGDSGLSVVSAAPATNATSNFLTTGNKNAFTGTFTAGHWEEAIIITDTSSTDTASHLVTIDFNSGTTAPSGTALSISPVTYTVVGVTGSTNPTITLYIDLGVTSITSPLNIYIHST